MSKLPVVHEEPSEPPPVSILDETDPLSLINLMPVPMRANVKRAALSSPHLFTMGEEEFLAHCKANTIHFGATDQMIRDQFWIEYHHVRAGYAKLMSPGRIIFDAISREGFYDHYLKNNYKVAWVCTMPLQYSRILKRNLTQLARNMGQVIDQPLIDPVTGKFDKSMAQIQLALLKFHEVTLHGTPTQRIEQKTMSLNVTRHEGAGAHAHLTGVSEEALAEKIKRLETQLRETSHVPKLAEWQTMPVTNVQMTKREDEK
jgi:hypothetical protein